MRGVVPNTSTSPYSNCVLFAINLYKNVSSRRLQKRFMVARNSFCCSPSHQEHITKSHFIFISFINMAFAKITSTFKPVIPDLYITPIVTISVAAPIKLEDEIVPVK